MQGGFFVLVLRYFLKEHQKVIKFVHPTSVSLFPWYPYLSSTHFNALFVVSRCVPAVTVHQRQRRRQRTSQTWTSVTQRQGRSDARGGPERSLQTVRSSLAMALLLAPARRHNQLDNDVLKTFRVTFTAHQPFVLSDHDDEEQLLNTKHQTDSWLLIQK